MYFYSAKLSGGIHTETDRFIFINDFGYNEDYSTMVTCRKNGRPDYQLIYVNYGTLTIHEEKGDILLSEGDVCLFRPNEMQFYSINGERTTHSWVLFTGSEVEKMLSFFKERSYHIGPFQEFEHFCRSHWSGFQAEQESAELILNGMLITIIGRIFQAVNQNANKTSVLSKLRPAVQIMKSQFNIRRSNEELASLCGLNKYYFIKLFKKNMGYSPQEFYARLLIDKSSELLRNTNINIYEIAKQCGIDDALYFSRLFKKHMGISPSAYRKAQI